MMRKSKFVMCILFFMFMASCGLKQTITFETTLNQYRVCVIHEIISLRSAPISFSFNKVAPEPQSTKLCHSVDIHRYHFVN